MNNQSAAQTDADERECSSPGEESSNTGPDAKTSSKITRSYWTKRLFFQFEIGVTSTRRQPNLGGGSQTPQPMRQAGGAQPVLVGGAAKAQVLVAGPAANGAPEPPPAAGPGVDTSSTKKVHVYAAAGISIMPPPDPNDPPR